MLRQSTQHMSGELDYVVQRPMRVQYTQEPGDIRDLAVGHVIPGEIAEAWGHRAVNNLIWVGRLIAVPRGAYSSDSEGGLVPADPPKPDWPRDLGGGVFQLSDGSRADGNLEALARQAELDAAGQPAGEAEPAVFELVKLGGGYYQLSDGSKVKGKNKAEAAQRELDAAAEGA